MERQLSEQPDASLMRAVIRQLQNGLPICDRPYAAVADELGITEQSLLSLLSAMDERGVIRRIGLVPNHYALGYSHNLMTVWDIKDEALEQCGREVGALPFVSHCYQRPRAYEWPYNFFAMVHGRDEQEAAEKQAIIARALGDNCRAHTSLRSTKILKKTGLRL